MSNELQTTSKSIDLNEFKKLFGPPPVLSSEDAKSYYDIVARLMTCIKPNDFLEQMLVKDLADTTWDIRRYSRHKALVIERQYLSHMEAENSRHEAVDDQQADAEEPECENEGSPRVDAPDVNESTEAGPACTAPTQVDQLFELEDEVIGAVSDVDQIIEASEELDYAEALESGIEYFERLDRLISISMGRRDDALKQIDFYRQGLGRQLRHVSDEIIDAEFHETGQQAPPLVAADGDEQ